MRGAAGGRGEQVNPGRDRVGIVHRHGEAASGRLTARVVGIASHRGGSDREITPARRITIHRHLRATTAGGTGVKYDGSLGSARCQHHGWRACDNERPHRS